MAHEKHSIFHPYDPFDDSVPERLRRMGLLTAGGKPDRDAMAVVSRLYAGNLTCRYLVSPKVRQLLFRVYYSYFLFHAFPSGVVCGAALALSAARCVSLCLLRQSTRP